MCTQIFFGIPPWGNLSEDEIFKLVVREDERPDRLGPDLGRQAGLTDRIWEILQAGWRKEITSRPTFAQIVHMWRDQAVLEVSETMPITSTLGNSAGEYLCCCTDPASPNHRFILFHRRNEGTSSEAIRQLAGLAPWARSSNNLGIRWAASLL
jgi:hypothetical protein